MTYDKITQSDLNFRVVVWVDPSLKLESVHFLIWMRKVTVGPTPLGNCGSG